MQKLRLHMLQVLSVPCCKNIKKDTEITVILLCLEAPARNLFS